MFKASIFGKDKEGNLENYGSTAAENLIKRLTGDDMEWSDEKNISEQDPKNTISKKRMEKMMDEEQDGKLVYLGRVNTKTGDLIPHLSHKYVKLDEDNTFDIKDTHVKGEGVDGVPIYFDDAKQFETVYNELKDTFKGLTPKKEQLLKGLNKKLKNMKVEAVEDLKRKKRIINMAKGKEVPPIVLGEDKKKHNEDMYKTDLRSYLDNEKENEDVEKEYAQSLNKYGGDLEEKYEKLKQIKDDVLKKTGIFFLPTITNILIWIPMIKLLNL